jgi:hypothetical protein
MTEQPQTDYTGTPEEVGAQLANDALGPTLNEAMAVHQSVNVMRMMAGMIAFLSGAYAENFGAEEAEAMLRGTADQVHKNSATLKVAQ